MSSKHVVFTSLGALLIATSALFASNAASAATQPLSNPGFIAHFDLAEGQNAENLTVLRDDDVDVTLALAHQVAQVTPSGAVRIIATMPMPPDGGVNTPLLGAPITAGIIHAPDGTIYVAYSAGSAGFTGVWRLCGSQSPVRVSAFPATALLNGMALDAQNGMIYVADSALNLIWRVPVHGGAASVWATGSQLDEPNGLKVHNGAVWVTNTANGLVVRIPIQQNGSAGPIETKATFPPGQLDDFDFIGRGDSILAALDNPNEVVLLQPDGTQTVVLTGADGIDNPSAVIVRGHRVYVTSGAYFAGTDPNLLAATLSRV